MTLRTPPLSIYVHLPWCVRKCPYCDFNSHVAPPDLPQARYVDWLLQDLEHDLPQLANREIQSIFFGGGTPSLFAPEQIDRLLQGLRVRIAHEANVEITMEANPGTIEHGRFSGYRDAGVTRISLGVQTFNDDQLRRLGRIHGSQQVYDAVAELRAAGFDNFNLDLMYALPEQTLEQALLDIEQALALKPAHLSHYQLTLEPGTVFFHQPPPLPDDDVAWSMQVESQARLAACGYEQYEVSAYAQSGRQCRHNVNYWQFGDYLGLGAGAHGKVTHADQVLRTVRIKQPREYLATSAAETRLSEAAVVAEPQLPFEFMLNVLRLRSGFTAEQFCGATGLSLDTIQSALATAIKRGLLTEPTHHRWVPTEIGRRFLNDLQALFLAS